MRAEKLQLNFLVSQNRWDWATGPGAANRVGNCAVNQDIVAVNLRDKTVCTRTQSTFRWEAMFSSIPLKSLCEMTNDEELVCASAVLSHSSTISFQHRSREVHCVANFRTSIGFTCPTARFLFIALVFIPISERAHAVPVMPPSMSRSVYRRKRWIEPNLINNLQPKVMRSLEELGWVDSRDVVCVVIHVMRHAYVHHTPQRDTAVETILRRLRDFSVFPIGRYGLWDYTSMEDSMETARAAVLELK